jgi:hypothetical protein
MEGILIRKTHLWAMLKCINDIVLIIENVSSERHPHLMTKDVVMHCLGRVIRNLRGGGDNR